MACCILHNYLIDKDPDRQIIAQVDAELANRANEPVDDVEGEDPQEMISGEQVRDAIAAAMWRDYNT